MKILQIISGRVINGALVYCKLLASQLQKQGHEVIVLTREDSWLRQELAGSHEILTSDMSRFPLTQIKRIAKLIDEQKIDLIHTHMSRGHSFGVMLKLFTNVPVVATAHSRSFQLHWCLNDRVIANSNATADYQLKVNRVAPSKLDTVHCFVDVDKFRQVEARDVRRVRRQLRLSGDEFVVGIVGDVCPRKGHVYLIDALERIVAAVPNFKLIILGRFHRNEPYTRQLRKRIVDRQLYHRTKWLGLRFNIEHFMSAFDLCVVPSTEEPLGMVAIEALAAGTPVVASKVGGLPEIVQHNFNGLLVPPKDSAELAEAIIKIASMEKTARESFGARGRDVVLRRFDPQLLTQQILDVYQKALSNNRSKAA